METSMMSVLPAAPTPPPPPRPPMSPVPGALPAIPTTATAMMPLKLDTKPVYSSPPPAASNPENNSCKMIEYRGAKVAAFMVDHRELICLPQAFELFLKHLVGGLHTVYTKLKRLDITPVVCNVEQVRILRGLGAIQPGVNRCKLIAPKEFDVLYDDCTNSSARPGRPPKRSSVMCSAPDTLEKLKKSRLDGGEFPSYHPAPIFDHKKSPLFGNGYHYPPHLASMTMPFMPLGHPMMSMAMANHLQGMRGGGAHDSFMAPNGSKSGIGGLASPTRLDYESETYNYDDDIRARDEALKGMEDNNNKMGDRPLNLEVRKDPDDRRHSFNDKESGVSTPSDYGAAPGGGHLDLSLRGPHHLPQNDDLDADDDSEEDKDDDEEDLDGNDFLSSNLTAGSSPDVIMPASKQPVAPAVQYSASILGAPEGHVAAGTTPAGLSSLETLLMNIQGLLKVAAENSRHRDRQVNFEKAELKMEIVREREMREGAEKRLLDEQRDKVTLQRRLKKEKRVRKRLQDQLEQLHVPGLTPPGGAAGNLRLSPPPSSGEQMRMTPDHLRYETHSLEMRREIEAERALADSPGMRHERLMMDTYGLPPPKACTTSNNATNGFLHSPIIKQAEAV